MSKVTIVSTVTYAVEIDLPPGLLVDEEALAKIHSEDAVAAVRLSAAGYRLLDVKASTVVVPDRPR